ncbi:MAG TPA: nuclear transport factor 2 family protein [Sphingobium sp.]
MTYEEKIDILWEERQVRKVILRFGRALDTGNWAAYRSCFTNPVTIDFKRLTGQDEVRIDADLWTLFAEQILSPTRRHHVYTNWDITLDGPRAHAHVYMTARHWKSTDLGVSHNTQYGWYDFWLERQTDGSWLMNQLKHDFQWVDGNNALLDVHEPELAKTMGQIFRQENFEAARNRSS